MTDRARVRFLTGALAVALLPALPGCGGPYHDAPPPPPPPRFPPYYYDYYYYPHVDVYFHIYSGHYWYRDGPYWRRVRRLPPHIHLHPRYRVVVRIHDEYPYRRHDEHRRRYPPPQPQPGPPPQGRPQPGPQPQPPSGRLREEFDWQERDREERRYNTRQYEEYRRKPWIAPK